MQCVWRSCSAFTEFRRTLSDIAREHGPPGAGMEVLHLVRAAQRLGLKARSVASSPDRLARVPLPADCEAPRRGIRGARARGQWPGACAGRLRFSPAAEHRDVRGARWSGTLILLTRRAGIADSNRHFDLTWFIPAVVKYRRLFGEVLVASFFLQLFALVTPLFFQVVIDKALVHRGLTTLDVLVIGLVGITVFEIVLGGLRTYVLSHTTSRVDVELGIWAVSDIFSACRSRTSSPGRWVRPSPGFTSSRPFGIFSPARR